MNPLSVSFTDGRDGRKVGMVAEIVYLVHDGFCVTSFSEMKCVHVYVFHCPQNKRDPEYDRSGVHTDG